MYINTIFSVAASVLKGATPHVTAVAFLMISKSRKLHAESTVMVNPPEVVGCRIAPNFLVALSIFTTSNSINQIKIGDRTLIDRHQCSPFHPMLL